MDRPLAGLPNPIPVFVASPSRLIGKLGSLARSQPVVRTDSTNPGRASQGPVQGALGRLFKWFNAFQNQRSRSQMAVGVQDQQIATGLLQMPRH